MGSHEKELYFSYTPRRYAAWRDTLTVEEILYELSLSLITFKTMQHEKRCSMMVCTARQCVRHSRAALRPSGTERAVRDCVCMTAPPERRLASIRSPAVEHDQ